MHDFLNSPVGRRTVLRRLGLVLGGVATAPLAPALLSGCRTPSPGEAYAYRTLSEPQQRTLAALVDRVIPATDTPGAAEAGVPQFVDTMLTDWYAPEERDRFLAGLDDVGGEGGAFVDLEPEAQARLVAEMDAAEFPPPGAPGAADEEPVDEDVAEAAQEGTYKAQEEEQNEVAGMQGDLGEAQDDEASMGQREVDEQGNEVDAPSLAEAGPSFYRQVKELTVAGYYTSEVGATEELRFNAIMGRYDPDVPLAEIGRAWA